MKHLILPWLETAMENIDQYETGVTYLRKILTFVNAREKKNLPVTENFKNIKDFRSLFCGPRKSYYYKTSTWFSHTITFENPGT